MCAAVSYTSVRMVSGSALNSVCEFFLFGSYDLRAPEVELLNFRKVESLCKRFFEDMFS